MFLKLIFYLSFRVSWIISKRLYIPSIMEFNKKGILARAKAATQETVVTDEGLRAYMLKVYNYMATGILLTGIIVY